MSDAKKQSVERCDYHKWEKTGTIDHAPEGTTTPFIRCAICKATPKAKEVKTAEAIIHLRSILNGWEHTRKMRKWELTIIKSGEPLRSYKPLPRVATQTGESQCL